MRQEKTYHKTKADSGIIFQTTGAPHTQSWFGYYIYVYLLMS